MGCPSTYLSCPINSNPVVPQFTTIISSGAPTESTFVSRKELLKEVVQVKSRLETGVSSSRTSRPEFCKEPRFCLDWSYPEVFERITPNTWSFDILSKYETSRTTLLLNILISKPTSFSVTVNGFRNWFGATLPLTVAVD